MKKLPDILLIISSVVISFGAWMIYIPAGIIIAGLFICFFSYSIEKAVKK